MDERPERESWSAWLWRLSEGLSDEASSWLDRIADAVIDRVHIRPGDRVIDLGAGTGLLTMRAARAVGSSGAVTALDSDPACLSFLESAASTSGYANIETVEGRLESIPRPAATFDAAVCRSALTYAPDMTAAVKETLRVLVKGGRFSVFEPLLGEVSWDTGGCLGELEADFAAMERTLAEKRSSYTHDRESIRRAFRRAGVEEYQSLPVHFTVNMSGRETDEIVREYLDDLPGAMSASRVLMDVMDPSRVRDVTRAFAEAASAGGVLGRLWGLFVWGDAPG